MVTLADMKKLDEQIMITSWLGKYIRLIFNLMCSVLQTNVAEVTNGLLKKHATHRKLRRAKLDKGMYPTYRSTSNQATGEEPAHTDHTDTRNGQFPRHIQQHLPWFPDSTHSPTFFMNTEISQMEKIIPHATLSLKRLCAMENFPRLYIRTHCSCSSNSMNLMYPRKIINPPERSFITPDLVVIRYLATSYPESTQLFEWETHRFIPPFTLFSMSPPPLGLPNQAGSNRSPKLRTCNSPKYSITQECSSYISTCSIKLNYYYYSFIFSFQALSPLREAPQCRGGFGFGGLSGVQCYLRNRFRSSVYPRFPYSITQCPLDQKIFNIVNPRGNITIPDIPQEVTSLQ
ncbi:hypothetical protein VP01_5860g1 [Puccinia sorghi]|uniref:Uncharacterized protein n=1 Tax=Puccinia sorghi TaxID=27349 RepID=A0A0L6UHX9_9BASI|nr:hypothetical protein VP01_5860g1 [Puccinia sorghi]